MPPPPGPTPNPLVMVNREMVAFDAKLWNTRKAALPLIARLAAPGPLIVTLCVIASSPLVSRIVPETPVASMVSPSAALARQARSVPAPLSAVLVTVQVFACTGIAAAKRSAVAIRGAGQARAERLREDLSEGRVFILPSQCGKKPIKTDIYFAFVAAL